MVMDDRDLLEVLKMELDFVEKSGYETSPLRPWRPQFIFEDSPTCPNFCVHPERVPCEECILIALVAPERRAENFPCRYIRLKDTGETIDYYYRCGTQSELEEALTEWLRKTIRRLEFERAQGVHSDDRFITSISREK